MSRLTQATIEYFRSRQGVLFFSHCRFWEKHGFHQQSLARHLVETGVKVKWLDSVGFMPYRPKKYFRSSLLDVRQLIQLPGNANPYIHRANLALQRASIQKSLESLGDRPVVWIHGGLTEELVRGLPYVDVYSVFDDPHICKPHHVLPSRARIITCQNSFAYEQMRSVHPEKTLFTHPPFEIRPDTFDKPLTLHFPKTLPSRIMGSVGSFMSNDYDLDLFEAFVKRLPEWGFLLCGRTDTDGERYVRHLKKFPNFFYIPWVPRASVESAWRALSVTLLLYRPLPSQEGAFSTRSIESFYFGVPCIATRAKKTEDLSRYVPRSDNIDELIELAQQALYTSKQSLREAYEHFSVELDPTRHLAQIAERLAKAEGTSDVLIRDVGGPNS